MARECGDPDGGEGRARRPAAPASSGVSESLTLDVSRFRELKSRRKRRALCHRPSCRGIGAGSRVSMRSGCPRRTSARSPRRSARRSRSGSPRAARSIFSARRSARPASPRRDSARGGDAPEPQDRRSGTAWTWRSSSRARSWFEEHREPRAGEPLDDVRPGAAKRAAAERACCSRSRCTIGPDQSLRLRREGPAGAPALDHAADFRSSRARRWS